MVYRPDDEADEPPEDTADEEYDADDPTDPRSFDFDLSEGAPYAGYEPPSKPWYTRRWVLIIVAAVTILGLLLPYLRNVL